jgi:ABC-2 type transport system ATP-binding protein
MPNDTDNLAIKPAQPENAIIVDHLVKRFGELVAVNDVSFRVAPREIFGLLGPNGAGKTTLIRMMTTLTLPTSGTAIIAGHDVVKDANGVRMVLGVIPQAFTSDPELTAEENMLMHAKLYGVPASKRNKLIAQLLESVDLTKFAKAFVRTFSGGMRRRLEIARGLIHSPQILFLDEPTTGLDPVSRTNVWEMIRRLREDSQLTILLTTHYMDEADKLCDRIAIVDHGRLVALDTPSNLKDSVPGTDTIEAEFTGAPADWTDQLTKLAHAKQVTQHDEVTHIGSNDGPATVAALMDLARSQHVIVRKVTVQSTTLDDVFMHFTGKDLRDTADTGARYDIGHLYARQ